MIRTALRAVVVGLLLAWGNAARADNAQPLKTEIEGYIHRIEASTAGRLHWDGADSFEVNTHEDTATATITNAHLSFRKDASDQKPAVSITLDRIEVRRAPAAAGTSLTEYAISLPALSTITGSDGTEVAASLKDGRMTVVLEAPGDRQRAASLTLAGGRIEPKNGKGWVGFGALTSNWRIIRNSDGRGWHAPVDFELKNLEFSIVDAPLAGSVDRIGYAGDATGSSLAELDALRDRMAQIRDQDKPDTKAAALMEVLPKLVTVFSSSHGELTVENITAKKPGGETQVTLTKATFGGGLSGLDGDKAALTLTMGYEGLMLAPALLPETQVPQRAVIDLALEDITTSALRALAEAASETGPGATDEARQKAVPQLLAAAMTLSPVLRLHEAAADFKHVKISATGEAKRAPPMPIGYVASADIAVSGFDALSDILVNNLERAYLPLLKFIGTAETAKDGTPSTKFHLTSALGQPFTVNGSNLASWFDNHATSGQPRTLRLADPPMSGDDVRAVQKALGAAQKDLADGVYDGKTALAVAGFQKQAGLNVDGVVDAKTRDKLGIPAPRALPLTQEPPPTAPSPPKN
jgi:hypothetical protein